MFLIHFFITKWLFSVVWIEAETANVIFNVFDEQFKFSFKAVICDKDAGTCAGTQFFLNQWTCVPKFTTQNNKNLKRPC